MDDMGMSYMRRMTIEWTNGQTATVWEDEIKDDSQMLHEFLCLTDIENYSVSFDSWVLKSAYMKYRMNAEREMADMRRECERLSEELSQLNARKQALAENYTRMCEHMDDKNREIANLKLEVKTLKDMIPGTSPE